MKNKEFATFCNSGGPPDQYDNYEFTQAGCFDKTKVIKDKPAIIPSGEYYNWIDIEIFLCYELGIPIDKFRNYHDIVGGDYKDFWHVWMKLVNNDVHSGKISTVDFAYIFETCEKVIDEFGEWCKPLIDAIEQLQEEVDDDYIRIFYF